MVNSIANLTKGQVYAYQNTSTTDGGSHAPLANALLLSVNSQSVSASACSANCTTVTISGTDGNDTIDFTQTGAKTAVTVNGKAVKGSPFITHNVTFNVDAMDGKDVLSIDGDLTRVSTDPIVINTVTHGIGGTFTVQNGLVGTSTMGGVVGQIANSGTDTMTVDNNIYVGSVVAPNGGLNLDNGGTINLVAAHGAMTVKNEVITASSKPTINLLVTGAGYAQISTRGVIGTIKGGSGAVNLAIIASSPSATEGSVGSASFESGKSGVSILNSYGKMGPTRLGQGPSEVDSSLGQTVSIDLGLGDKAVDSIKYCGQTIITGKGPEDIVSQTSAACPSF